MKLSAFSFSVLGCLLLSVPHAAADGWRISAGYAPMIGLQTKFSGFGNFQNPFPVPAPAGATNYFYSDGFVQVDSTGNAGGLTSYWMYNNASQYNPAGFGGQGSIDYHTLSSGLNNYGSTTDSGLAAAASFEIHGYLDLGAVSFLPTVSGRSATWGLRTGVQYSRVDDGNSNTLGASIGSITDSFNLNGVVPLAPGVSGTFLGPNALLGDTPTRTTGTAAATISGYRQLGVNLAITSFGSYVEIPVAEKIDLMLEGGALLALANASYRYESTVSVAGAGTQTTSGGRHSTRLLPGVYGGLGVLYHITDRLGLQSSVRYQFLKQLDLGSNGSNASLSFNSALVLSLSVSYKF